MDRAAWWAAGHGVAEGQTRLSRHTRHRLSAAGGTASFFQMLSNTRGFLKAGNGEVVFRYVNEVTFGKP